jgi:uncharacterized protein (TIGR03437 family)
MKRLLAGFSLFACVLAAQTQTVPVTCSAATLSGTRSLVLTGRSVLSTGQFSKSYYGVGTATFDGAGNVTFNLTTDTNQAQNAVQTLSGIYTLPSNCAGTLNIITGDVAAFTLIPYNSGKNFTLTGEDATYNLSGSGATQPTACLTSTLSGAYTFSGNGFPIASSVIAGVDTLSGLLQFDGAGSISGTWSVATNGALTPAAVSGTYSVSSPSCVASATISDANGNAYSLAFTVTSTDGANFSVIGASATSLFSASGHSTFTNPGLAVGNAAGVTGGTPPGSLFSIYGFNLASGQAQPTSFPLPTTDGSATVTVNNEAVPLTYVDKEQINAQMPLDIQPGVATLVVKTGTAQSNSVAIAIPSTPVPGVFIYGSNHAAAQNYPSYTLNSSSAPAIVGEVVIVYFTGGGAVHGASSIITGHATPNEVFPVTASYSATVGGVAANVGYVGLTPGFAGLYQANLTIPSVPAGQHPLVLTIGGVASNSTTISTK